MAKFKPGIPDNFDLNVQPVRDLGDYLDEPAPTPRPARKQPAPPVEEGRGTVVPSPPAAPVTVTPNPQPVAPPTVARPQPLIEENVPSIPPEPPRREGVATPQNHDEQEERGPRPKSPRREISMTPDTLRMSDELLDMIRSGSGQRDTKANEMFHALVLLVYEVRNEIDLHRIPKRGRWGTPTARAYPLELKNAFLQALLRKHAEEQPAASPIQYPMSSAG